MVNIFPKFWRRKLKIKNYVDTVLTSLTYKGEMMMSSIIAGYDNQRQNERGKFKIWKKLIKF